MGNNNYINDYGSFDNPPNLKKTQAANDAGKTAARRFAEEQRRREINDDARRTARKVGAVPPTGNAPRQAQQGANRPNAARRAPNPSQSQVQGNGTAPRRPQTQAQMTNTSYPGVAGVSLPKITLNATTVLLGLVVVLTIFSFVAFGRLEQNHIPLVEKESVMGDIMEELEPELKEGYVNIPVSSSNLHAGPLQLVNAEYAYVFNNVPDLVPAEELATVNNVKTSKNYKVKDNTVKLNRTTIAALDAMFNAFFEATEKKDVMISAGYRTEDDQQTIYDKKIMELGVDQKTAQLPGYSEHHTGYSIDFNIYTDGGITKQFLAQDEYAWVAQNAYKYGFILRYPEGKTDITGIDHEIWHYRYVGVPHAYYLHNSGKTLEEYMTLLQNYPCDYPLQFTDNTGTEYLVYYKKSAGSSTNVPVPEKGEYSISGNNVDGYIVTVKNTSQASTQTQTVNGD